MKLSKFDINLIKVNYGSVKNYNNIKKEKIVETEKIIELETRIKEREILSHYSEQIKHEQEIENILKAKNDIKKAMLKIYGGRNGNYKKWIIVWDLLNNNYYEIENSLLKAKITKDDIIEVINNCNDVHNIFDINLVL